jgi:hypothetical protein
LDGAALARASLVRAAALRLGALRACFFTDCGRRDVDLTMEPRILIAPGH